MAGTKIGGIKAKEANLAKYSKDYYKNIGRKGGVVGKRGYKFIKLAEKGFAYYKQKITGELFKLAINN